MDEKQNKKITFGTLIFMIIAVILFILIIGLIYYSQKESGSNQQTISKLEEKISDLQTTINNMNKGDIGYSNEANLSTNKEITLTDAEKVAINAGLEYGFGFTLRYITDDEISNIEYNTNLLEKELNKYYVVVWTTRKEKDMKFTKGEVDGEVSIELETLKKYYNKILGIDMDEQALISASNMEEANISIKDGILYDTIVTGWGTDPMALKVKNLILDETTRTYTITTDFIYADNGNIKDEENDYAGQYDNLTYSNSLIKAELEIKYQEKENGDKVLTSLIFKK